MSESSVSIRLRSLEDTLTVALFHRSSEGVEPTNAGSKFFARSREALRILDLAMADAAAGGRGVTGRLTIGLYTSLSMGKLRGAIGEFSHEHPDIQLELIEGSRSRMIEGLSARTIDLTVLIGPPDPVLGEALPLWREQAYSIVPKTHPFAGETEIGWDTLANEMLLFSTRDAGPEAESAMIARLGGPGRWPQPPVPRRQPGHAADLSRHGPGRCDDDRVRPWQPSEGCGGGAARRCEGSDERNAHSLPRLQQRQPGAAAVLVAA